MNFRSRLKKIESLVNPRKEKEFDYWNATEEEIDAMIASLKETLMEKYGMTEGELLSFMEERRRQRDGHF